MDPGILVRIGAKPVHRALPTPAVTRARFCLRHVGELSCSQVSLEADDARVLKEATIRGAADRAPILAKRPCCTVGIMAPTGWLDLIVVITTVVQAAVIAKPQAE